LPKQKYHTFVKAFLSDRNHYISENENPFKLESLHYLGLDGSCELSISDRFLLNLALMLYEYINYKNPQRFNFTQYIIGLNFDFINP
jgi:hypothetical protein